MITSSVNRYARGHVLCQAFAKALKLNRPVRSVMIKAACSEPVLVTVEFVASEDDAAALASIQELEDTLG